MVCCNAKDQVGSKIIFGILNVNEELQSYIAAVLCFTFLSILTVMGKAKIAAFFLWCYAGFLLINALLQGKMDYLNEYRHWVLIVAIMSIQLTIGLRVEWLLLPFLAAMFFGLFSECVYLFYSLYNYSRETTISISTANRAPYSMHPEEMEIRVVWNFLMGGNSDIGVTNSYWIIMATMFGFKALICLILLNIGVLYFRYLRNSRRCHYLPTSYDNELDTTYRPLMLE